MSSHFSVLRRSVKAGDRVYPNVEQGVRNIPNQKQSEEDPCHYQAGGRGDYALFPILFASLDFVDSCNIQLFEES